MPGTNYIGNAYQTLSGLLGKDIPGASSAGFDSLSSGYDAGVSGGMSDITRRGLSNTGAFPQLYTNLNEEYNAGAGQVSAQAIAAQNQQTQQVLNQILGLGGPALQASEQKAANQAQEFGDIGATVGGLFGKTGATIFGPASQGFLSSGLYGNSRALLNQLLNYIP